MPNNSDANSDPVLNEQRPVLSLLTSHWLGMLGVALVTTAGCSWLFVLPLHLRGRADNPYIGLLTFIGIPIVFFLGLILIPIGMYLGKQRILHGLAAVRNRRAVFQRVAVFIGVMTAVNLVLGSQLTYRAVQQMETNQFCGQSCHVLKPQFTRHLAGAHRNVGCVDCHVTPGASGFVTAKISGTRQLSMVAFDSYPRPIPAGLATNHLAPSAETCEQCHARAFNMGSKLRVITGFKDDEANTRIDTVLMMQVGGGDAAGIHRAHLGAGVEIRYAATDSTRQTIPWVEYRDTAKNQTTTYIASDAKPDAVSQLPRYTMQCADCHNRVGHDFTLPARAVDKAMAAGDIPASLPFAHKTGVEALKAVYASDADASAKIPAALLAFYSQKYPGVAAKQSADIQRASRALTVAWQNNIFPEYKIAWGTYPSNLGHTDAPGCFRCHDESHSSAAKKTISQDCNLCHQALAVEETNPAILKSLGLLSAR
jgi:hypothetical protein